jgi:hypothetical protein
MMTSASGRISNDDSRINETRSNEQKVTFRRLSSAFVMLISFVIRHWCFVIHSTGSLSFFRSLCGVVRKNESHWLWRVNTLLDLLLQRAFGFGRQPAFFCFFAGKLGQDR